MRWVEIEVRGEDGKALGVGRFGEKAGARFQLGRGQLHQTQHSGRRQMFGHLGAEQAAERAVRKRFEIGKEVCLFDGKPLLTAQRREFRRGFHAASGDACIAEQAEELAASAADVEHLARSFAETLDVLALAGLYILG